jgi:DNA-binding XRE family transcriptional regulator
MEHQDWTPVVIKRRLTKKEATSVSAGSSGSSEVRDSQRNERARMAKVDMLDYSEAPKKRIESESIQTLIRKRMEMKLNQEKADQLCNFPKHTFKNIESNRVLPTSQQQSLIQKHFGVQLKIVTF